jgi:putative Holliday junction resolvase
MRTLAIDPGSKRIGLALSDANAKLATPLTVLQITTQAQALEKILKLIKEEQVERILIGLPLNMDGSEGKSAHLSRELGAQLAAQSHKPVLFIDERLTSFQADEILKSRKQSGEKITRKQKKSRQDAHAAAIFLQEFLDNECNHAK